MRQINVTPPDPMTGVGCFRSDQPGGLRIVNHDEIFIEGHPLAVLFGVQHKDVARLLRQRKFAAVQSIVEPLSHFEKIISAGDDIPGGLDFEFIQ